jgi:hypothetical protein
MTLSINMECDNAECRIFYCTECRLLIVVVLNVVVLIVMDPLLPFLLLIFARYVADLCPMYLR